ncbi:MAG: hypothetical protein V4436_03270 [Patescibacteria group bacterium]
MSPLFGRAQGRQAKKNRGESTIAVLDIESGSVASGLVRISPNHKPQLLGQDRRALSTRRAPSAEVLLNEIEREIEESLLRLSGLTSRMRSVGVPNDIDRIAVFLHAPWITVSLLDNRAKADAHDAILEQLRDASRVLNEVPVTFHAFATTTTPIIHGLFNAPQESLVISIGSEVAELSLLRGNNTVGYATVPAGLSTVLRTLESHAGVSRPQALSILNLSRSSREHAWAEALAAGVGQVTKELRQSTKSLLSELKGTQQIFVVAQHPTSDFFARMLTEDPGVHELFAPGSTIRAVSPKHATPYLSAHPQKPDVPLLLESLFVDTRFGS